MIDHSPKILRAIRKYFGLNQVELANILGVRQGTLSKIESGKLELGATQWVKVCNQYKIDPNCIFTGEIDGLVELPSDSTSVDRIGNFKINKKFTKNMSTTVRAMLPLLEYFEKKLGTDELNRFLGQHKIDADYFVIKNLPINLLAPQEIYNTLKIYNFDPTDITIEETQLARVHTPFLEKQGQGEINFKKLTKLLPQYLDVNAEFTFVGDDSCFISKRERGLINMIPLDAEFKKFWDQYQLAHLNGLAKLAGQNQNFLLQTVENGWNLVLS